MLFHYRKTPFSACRALNSYPSLRVCTTSGIRQVCAVFRSGCGRTHDQRALGQRSAWIRNKRRHTRELLLEIVRWLCGVTVMRSVCVTTRSSLDRTMALALNLGAHRRVGATEKTTTSHPNRDTRSQQQSNRLVRKNQHLAEVYSRADILVEAETRFS